MKTQPFFIKQLALTCLFTFIILCGHAQQIKIDKLKQILFAGSLDQVDSLLMEMGYRYESGNSKTLNTKNDFLFYVRKNKTFSTDGIYIKSEDKKHFNTILICSADRDYLNIKKECDADTSYTMVSHKVKELGIETIYCSKERIMMSLGKSKVVSLYTLGLSWSSKNCFEK
jgi:hypothetical protein